MKAVYAIFISGFDRPEFIHASSERHAIAFTEKHGLATRHEVEDVRILRGKEYQYYVSLDERIGATEMIVRALKRNRSVIGDQLICFLETDMVTPLEKLLREESKLSDKARIAAFNTIIDALHQFKPSVQRDRIIIECLEFVEDATNSLRDWYRAEAEDRVVELFPEWEEAA